MHSSVLMLAVSVSFENCHARYGPKCYIPFPRNEISRIQPEMKSHVNGKHFIAE